MRSIAFAALILLLPVGAAQGPSLAADLDWEIGVGTGDLAWSGGAWGVRVPREVRTAAPEAAAFVVEGEHVIVREEYRDYVAVGSPPSLVETDRTTQVRETWIRDARLKLADLRGEVQFLAVPIPGSEAPFQVQAAADNAIHQGNPRVDLTLFQPLAGTRPAEHLDRQYHRDTPAVRIETEASQGVTRLSGDFVVHLWEMDLADAVREGPTFRSGQLDGDADLEPHSPSEPTPAVAYTTRLQLLTLEVTNGHVTFALPGRATHFLLDPATARTTSAGEWELLGATGTLSWRGAHVDVNGGVGLHMRGTFALAFQGLADDGRLVSRWRGDAEAIAAGSEPIRADAVEYRGPAGLPVLWLLAIGAVIAAAGGGVALRLRRPTKAPLPPGPPTEASVTPEQDALVHDTIALLQDGKAAEVIQALEPGYDPKGPVAAVHAYLLSLAYLAQKRNTEALTWVQRALTLYPEFQYELEENPAFAPIRNDPRFRRYFRNQASEDWSYA